MTPSLTCSPPWIAPRLATPRRPERDSGAGALADALALMLYARPLMPWQRYVADVAGELDPATGRPAYATVVVHVPRRAGKTALVLVTLLRRLLGQPRSRSWYTAQTGADARRTFLTEWLVDVQHSAQLARLLTMRGSDGRPVLGVSRRPGAESFTFGPRGSSVTCFAPVESALHGTNVDLVVIDEAWDFTEEAGRRVEDAVFPAQLTRPGSQTWIVSAGGTIESTWLDGWLVRAEAAAGRDGATIALFDWGADPSSPTYDPDDPAVWWSAHPALGHTITEADVAAERDRMDLATFERSILNVWPRPREIAGAVIDLDTWADLAGAQLAAGRQHVVAFDVAGDRGHAALVAAGRDDAGRVVCELIDYRAGSGWLPDAVRAWRRDHGGGVIVCDGYSGAAAADDVERAGLAVIRTGVSDMARACASLVDAVLAATLVHGCQEPVTAALASAGRRVLGDGWAWSRRRSGADISPLVALTLAAWGARSRPPTPAPFIVTAR